jgi:hypothetical protein
MAVIWVDRTFSYDDFLLENIEFAGPVRGIIQRGPVMTTIIGAVESVKLNESELHFAVFRFGSKLLSLLAISFTTMVNVSSIWETSFVVCVARPTVGRLVCIVKLSSLIFLVSPNDNFSRVNKGEVQSFPYYFLE